MATHKEFAFDVGDEVRDTITAFTGVVVCRTQWLHNCNTYGVKPRELKDGRPQDSVHFDEPALELVAKENVKTTPAEERTGGPERPIPQTNR